MAFFRKLSFWKYQIIKWIRVKLRRRFKFRHILFFGIIKLLLVIIFYLYKWNFLCSNIHIHQVIEDLCVQYSHGNVVGSYCDVFCGEDASLVVESCQTWHGGKDIVFSALVEGNKKVFIKGQKPSLNSDSNQELVWSTNNDGSKLLPPDLETFEAMVNSFLKVNADIDMVAMKEDTFDRLWDFPITSTSGTVMNMAMKNLWALLQDNEYILAKVYQDFELFPRVYGTCGGLYAVEHLDQLAFPSFFGTNKFSEWSLHVSVAIAILEFLDELESTFQHPVHLCDIKSSHFGISYDGKIKFLDLDTVYLKSALDKSMTSSPGCEVHSDCNVFDCKGQCDLIRGQCINGVVNNNLQVICEKIFLSRKVSDRPDSLFSSGFLHSKHMNRRLEQALNRCANPTGAMDDTRLAASPDLKIELYAALNEILDLAIKLEKAESSKSNGTMSKSTL